MVLKYIHILREAEARSLETFLQNHQGGDEKEILLLKAEMLKKTNLAAVLY